MDVPTGARMVIRSCMGVQMGENVLVITDDDKFDIGNEFYVAALEAGARALLVKIDLSHESREPPGPLAELMRMSDAIVMVTKHSMSQTKARRDATKAGARVVSAPGLTRDSIVDGSLTADFGELELAMRRIYRRVRGAKKVTISSALGTNLTFGIKGRSWVAEDTGICDTRGSFTTLPAGEIFIAPIEGSASGTLIVDGSFEGLLERPAKVTIEDGLIMKVIDAPGAIAKMNLVGKEARFLAKFGIGLNPKARITGNVLEDEKKLGSASIGFGGNSTFGGRLHSGILVSAVLREPEVLVDDIQILKGGIARL